MTGHLDSGPHRRDLVSKTACSGCQRSGWMSLSKSLRWLFGGCWCWPGDGTHHFPVLQRDSGLRVPSSANAPLTNGTESWCDFGPQLQFWRHQSGCKEQGLALLSSLSCLLMKWRSSLSPTPSFRLHMWQSIKFPDFVCFGGLHYPNCIYRHLKNTT